MIRILCAVCDIRQAYKTVQKFTRNSEERLRKAVSAILMVPDYKHYKSQRKYKLEYKLENWWTARSDKMST